MSYGPTDEEAHFEGARAASISAYRATLDTRDALLGEAFKTIGPASEGWTSLEEKLINAKDDCQAKFAALRRATDAMRISKFVIFFFFVCFALLEAPINKFMFDIVLKSNNLESYFVSLLVTAAMLGLAHIAGTQTRQMRGAFEDKFYFGKIVVVLIIMMLLVLCVGILTIGRASYSAAGSNLPNLDIFSHMGVQVQNLGLWAALLAAFSDRAAVILATLNIAGIACAFFFAFITHDSDMFYQAAIDEAASAQRKFGKLAKKYEKRISKVGRKFAPRLAGLVAAHGSQNAKVIAHKRMRNTPLTEDDRVDISTFDTKLAEARHGIGDRARRVAHLPEEFPQSQDNLQSISPMVARERR
jgi:hypothetical protein